MLSKTKFFFNFDIPGLSTLKLRYLLLRLIYWFSLIWKLPNLNLLLTYLRNMLLPLHAKALFFFTPLTNISGAHKCITSSPFSSEKSLKGAKKHVSWGKSHFRKKERRVSMFEHIGGKVASSSISILGNGGKPDHKGGPWQKMQLV